MRFKTAGSAINQYAIIIALVILAISPLFMVFGKNIVSYFSHLKTSLSEKSLNNQASTAIEDPVQEFSKNIFPGELGGTMENPIQKCAGNICHIDYGDFVLSGVPQNFGEFVQSAGASGGTDELLKLLEQLLVQIQKDPEMTPDEIAKIQNLMAKGKDIVKLEKYFESILDKYQTDIKDYVSDKYTLRYKFENGDITEEEFNTKANQLDKKYEFIRKDLYEGIQLQLSNGVDMNIDIKDMDYLINPNAAIVKKEYFSGDEYYTFDVGYNQGVDFSKFLNGEQYLDVMDRSKEYQKMKEEGKLFFSPVGEYITELKLNFK
ncbi:MAG: hypothetical protein AB1782_07590 [Cyanobacteriota bacterium]